MYEAGRNWTFPDRGEYFWARQGGVFGGKGPNVQSPGAMNDINLMGGVANTQIMNNATVANMSIAMSQAAFNTQVATTQNLLNTNMITQAEANQRNAIAQQTFNTNVTQARQRQAAADQMARNGAALRNPVGPVSLRYNDLWIINEAAIDRFSIAVAMPYREIEYTELPPGAPLEVSEFHAAGWSDMHITTKSLFLDCELMQMAFQFRTYIPIGNFTKGIGNGHVTLEPSLLWTVKLTPDCYLQTQVSEWIPVGGDTDYQAAIIHYHGSLNQVLWRPAKPVEVIGSAEAFGYTFQGGEFSDPAFSTTVGATTSAATAIYVGAGFRIVACDKIDIGFGAAFEVTESIMAREIYRTEFRWRF
jgi:hypothetical protein